MKVKCKLMQLYRGPIGNRLTHSNWNVNLNKKIRNGGITIGTPQISLNQDKDYLWEDGEKLSFFSYPLLKHSETSSSVCSRRRILVLPGLYPFSRSCNLQWEGKSQGGKILKVFLERPIKQKYDSKLQKRFLWCNVRDLDRHTRNWLRKTGTPVLDLIY